MFNLKFDWRIIPAVAFLAIVGWFTYNYNHNASKVESQADTITKLEATLKSNKELYETNIGLLKEQTDLLNRTVEIERGYNENIKSLEKVIAANNSTNSSLLVSLRDLRSRNQETPASTETYIRRVDVLTRSLEEVSRGYGEASSDHSRARIEFNKCKSYLDDIYKSNDSVEESKDATH